MESNNLKSWISAHDASKPSAPAQPVPRPLARPAEPVAMPAPTPAPVSAPTSAAPALASTPITQAPEAPARSRVTLPRSSKLRAALRRQSPRSLALVVLGLAVVVTGVWLLGWARQSRMAGVGTKTDSTTRSSQSSLPHDSPSFALVYPAGKSAASLEIVRVSPDGRDPVYAFYDKLDGQTILISQQKLPSQFKSGQASELERVAKDFQATSTIQIDGQKVYHGLSDRSKTQSLIFIKKDLLILIKSPVKLSDTDWVGYITGLR